MKDFLFITKEIYQNKDRNKEMKIIKSVEDNFLDDLNKILKLLNN